MKQQVRKAVFPVAGLGTRFLPATKANPKEMLPIVDKPLIQYAVEEAVAAGITQLIFVTNMSKRAIEDHFDSNYELEAVLNERGKLDLLEQIRTIIPKEVTCVYIRQSNPLGLGHAVLTAKSVVGQEPFAVILADDLVDGARHNPLNEMIQAYHQTRSSIIATEPVDEKDVDKYGIVDVEKRENDIAKIKAIVEKPKPTVAPSNFAVIGRYILTPQIFPILETIGQGAGDEIQLTDGISQLLKQESAYAYFLKSKRYDCGSKIGYLQATISYGLKHPELRDELMQYLQDITDVSVQC